MATMKEDCNNCPARLELPQFIGHLAMCCFEKDGLCDYPFIGRLDIHLIIGQYNRLQIQRRPNDDVYY